jgi:hypothetical protein
MDGDMKKMRDELNNCKVDLIDAQERLKGSTSPTSNATQDAAIKRLEAQNAQLASQLRAAQGGAGEGEVAALEAQLKEKDDALDAKAAENAELQKVCDELFQLVEAKGDA